MRAGCRRSTSRSRPATRCDAGRERAPTVIDVPGHTVGHVAYHFAEAGALFSADSLMVMGCGRLFEGTAEQMWDSLSRLAALPDATLVYSGHEYAESNARFALSVDGGNEALVRRAGEIGAMRQMGAATVPARLDLERATNPFLRVSAPTSRRATDWRSCPMPRFSPRSGAGRTLSEQARHTRGGAV